MAAKHLFSTFDVTRQVFYSNQRSLAIVNLKPLLPGHVLVIPKRVVPRLADLQAEEVSDLFLAVQRVGSVVEKAYGGSALTFSIQDGKDAGQSVPHVHVHILPRKATDFGGDNDKIYTALEGNENELGGRLEALSESPNRGTTEPTAKTALIGQNWAVDDEERVARTTEDMEKEAAWLRGLF